METAENTSGNENLRVTLPEHRPAAWNRAVSYSLDEKIDGMNRAAKVRGALFIKNGSINGKEINAGMTVFLKEMRCRTNNRARENSRVLSAIFFLAGIDKAKHDSDFKSLNEDEQIRLIEAMNQIKAVTSIFPTDLAIK